MAPWILALLIATGVGGVVVATHWDEVKNWLADFLPKIASVIRQIGQKVGGKFEHVAMVAAEKIDRYAAVIKHVVYLKEMNGTWTEKTKVRNGLLESDLLPEIQQKLRNKRKADITDYVEDELGLSLS